MPRIVEFFRELTPGQCGVCFRGHFVKSAEISEIFVASWLESVDHRFRLSVLRRQHNY